jgi:hypothetical protein
MDLAHLSAGEVEKDLWTCTARACVRDVQLAASGLTDEESSRVSRT